MSAARCRTPLDLSDLATWWTEDLPAGEGDRIEEHLFGCGECAASAERFAALAGAIRALARDGSIRVIVGASWLERVADEGLRVREYRLRPGGSVACTVTPEDDFVIARLAVDRHEAVAVDLSWCDAEGHELERLRDLPLREDADEILWVQEMDWLRALGVSTGVARLIARSAEGEQVLAEYTFNHTPSPRA